MIISPQRCSTLLFTVLASSLPTIGDLTGVSVRFETGISLIGEESNSETGQEEAHIQGETSTFRHILDKTGIFTVEHCSHRSAHSPTSLGSWALLYPLFLTSPIPGTTTLTLTSLTFSSLPGAIQGYISPPDIPVIHGF